MCTALNHDYVIFYCHGQMQTNATQWNGLVITFCDIKTLISFHTSCSYLIHNTREMSIRQGLMAIRH